MNRFDKRIEELNKSTNTPSTEITAAISIYERMVTAKEICGSVVGPGAEQKSEYLIPVFEALCIEASSAADTEE